MSSPQQQQQQQPFEFCNAGVATPPLGLGLAALGRPGYINLGHAADLPSKTVEEMREQAFGVLDTAWDAGVRYFDAARSYGRSEAGGLTLH